MSRLGFKSVVYLGDLRLGELDVISVTNQNFQFPNNEIRIHHISPRGERCPPLSILQTISAFPVRCKLGPLPPSEQPNLINLHASCLFELKTAVALVGDEEIHLVAMPSKRKKFPCFWCYSVPVGLYNACLRMLNLRCLAIVFDLDETLIVANTMKSFEDRIEALRGWLARETDPLRVSGMSAELRRYMEDRMILKQYAESDSVVDNGKIVKVQLEEVAPLSDNHEKVVRPVIRLQERNIVLTRINPEIRDTSVLVRLRPAWEDLRCYISAKGRKRFEVYVCTMAKRDYALEMWRLLDPEAHLIGSTQLLDRVICVKSGSRKSLLNVFQDGTCHPKMAMVIDDRSQVWEDKDQPRVHVVPAFTPYYAPEAETANAVPVLCVARNVACNVRGCFFKEFDENLMQRSSEVFYEDEVVSLPHAPDVSNYLMSEDAGIAPNNAPLSDGLNGMEVECQLNQPEEKFSVDSVTKSVANNVEFRSETSQSSAGDVSNVIYPRSSITLKPSQSATSLFDLHKVMDPGNTSTRVEREFEAQSPVIREIEEAQHHQGDCLPTDVSVEWPQIHKVDFEQNNLDQLRKIWSDMGRKADFESRYGHLAHLLFVPIHTEMLKAILYFWDPCFRVFTFGKFDLVPTIEEYNTLLKIDTNVKDKVYYPDKKGSLKRQLARLMQLQTKEISQQTNNGESSSWCVPATYLLEFAQNKINTDQGLAIFALAIYGLVLFPKVKEHIDGKVIGLFVKMEHRANPVTAILAETIQSLNHLRQNGEGRFIGCAQLLTVWMFSHIPQVKCLRLPKIQFSSAHNSQRKPLLDYSTAEWPQATPSRNQWIVYFQNLSEVVWKSAWLGHNQMIYGCGDKHWLPLIGVWGIVGYAPTMGMRQLGMKQFIPTIAGLTEFDCNYGDEGASQKLKIVVELWKQVQRITSGPSTHTGTESTTVDYPKWQSTREGGFIAPKIQRPEVPLQQTDDPVNPQAHLEARYETVFHNLQEREAALVQKEEQLSVERGNLMAKMSMLEEEVQNLQKTNMENAQQYQKELDQRDAKLKQVMDKCRAMEEDSLQMNKKIEELENEKLSYQMYIEGREAQHRQELGRLSCELSRVSDNNYWYQKTKKIEEELHNTRLDHQGLLSAARSVADKARMRVREVEDLTTVAKLGEVQDFLEDLYRDLRIIDRFN